MTSMASSMPSHGALTLLEHRGSKGMEVCPDSKPSLPRQILRHIDSQGDSPMKSASTRRSSQCSTEAMLSPRSAVSSGGPSRVCSEHAGFADLEEVTLAASRLKAGAFQVPHPEKVEYGGEDSFFISCDGLALGVADGVGEWGWRFGLNPRDFAMELMEGTMRSAEDQFCSDTDAPVAERARQALSAGFNDVKSFGAATALVVTLNAASGELGVANLGDSGLRLLRPTPTSGGTSLHVVERTEEQQHEFNLPFQLSKVPKAKDFPKLRAEGKSALIQAVKAHGAAKSDAPSDAAMYTFGVEAGDVLVLGSDGLFDNLGDDEICAISQEAIAVAGHGAIDTQELARVLAVAAARRSTDKEAETPFCLQAARAGMEYRGGKVDDITVVVAVVEA
eukprot:CAMPEP_0176105406 /NCGR_PEP_ID=MMETSP0120_2-20121206/52895_1 /TAXON_ID=160619 /ORGANISM="Kryptoperidinium foliaceum, Strain CCMP 1326" /LENGTH=391 /DNA_ID=CAMNT_0017439523 /DNA_START=65 /DNA_END=1240 /DNA_ORIENTATION=+